MTECSEDATILIATSWQALKRARNDSDRTRICNCTVVVVFAAFFIESNLNLIVDAMGKTSEMNRFLKNPYAGLQDKLAWFYNSFIARPKAATKRQMYYNQIVRKLRRKFPGFGEIYEFRNNISYGVIDPHTANLQDSERLRRRAKSIEDELFRIA